MRIAKRLAVPDAHDAIPLRGQPGISLGVTALSFGVIMPAAVDLDHQPRAVMDEVGDIATDRRLTADVEIHGA